MMRLIPLLLISLFSCPALGFIKPGERSHTHLPRLRSEATVVATTIADDGSVFLLGDFNEVDGVSRPGLAKLSSTGYLDHSFNPKTGVAQGIQLRTSLLSDAGYFNYFQPIVDPTYDFGYISRLSPKIRPLFFPDEDLFALNDGRLFLRKWEAWTVLKPDGSLDENAFPGFDRKTASLLPQFRHGNRLIALTADDRLVALDLANGDNLDPTFTLDPDWTGTILQSVPAGNNALWVLSHRDPFQVVCRLNSDGSMDPSFPPLELRDGHRYRIESGTSGGFILTNRIPYHPTTCAAVGGCGPVDWKNEIRLQWFSNIGLLKGEIRHDFGVPGREIFQTHPSYRTIVFNHNSQDWESKSISINTITLTEFPTPSPNDSSTLPLIVETIDLLRGQLGGSARDYLLGGTRLYLSNGTLATHRHIPRLTRQALLLSARELPDGSLFIAGDFNQVDDHPCRGMIRLTPEGAYNVSFAPTLDLRFTKEFEVSENGRVFVLLHRPWTAPDDQQYTLLALSPSGEVEQGYFPEPSISDIQQIELLADGSLVIETSSTHRWFWGWNWNTSLQRILPSGEIDQNWGPDPQLSSFASQKILALRDGSFLWGGNHHDAEGNLLQAIGGASYFTPLCQNEEGTVLFANAPSSFYSQNQIHRWSGGPNLDPTFRSGLSSNGSFISGAIPGSRGKVLLWGRLNTPAGIRSIVRLHPTGQIDYTFNPLPLQHHLHPTSTEAILTGTGLQDFELSRFSFSSSPNFILRRENHLLAGGSYGDSEGNFVHLADAHLSGYSDWITSATGNEEPPSDDFDQDGRTNLHEYALGTDPIRPDAFTHDIQRTSLSPLRFQLSCNPEAPEVQRTIEVSTDLINWEFGTAQHFTTEPGSGCLNLRMTESEHRLFLRTRYSQP